MLRSLALALVAFGFACLAHPGVAHGDRRVLVRLASDDPLSAAIALELRWRGLDALIDGAGSERTPDERYESLVMAQVFGADAAVWLERGPDGGGATLHAVRTLDGLAVSSPMPMLVELREAAVVAAMLAEELLGVAPVAPCVPEARSAQAPAGDAHALGNPFRRASDVRMYGLFGVGLFLQFDRPYPSYSAHVALGAEWASGFRLGAAAAALVSTEVYEFVRADGSAAASGVTFGGALPAAGLEASFRAQLPRFALRFGAHVLGGPAVRHTEAESFGHWGGVVVTGFSVVVMMPLGRNSELGVRGDVDLWFEDRRDPSTTPRISLEWGWR